MKRIQRKRTRGWRMPPNAKYIGRPTKWGNIFDTNTFPITLEQSLSRYESWIRDILKVDSHFLDELKGKDLACWCPLKDKNGNPVACHADVILRLLNDDKKIVLSEEDRKALAELYHRAETTPMIAMTSDDMLHGRDWASRAWDEVRAKMDELGKKYGFDPRTMKGISSKTGEVSV